MFQTTFMQADSLKFFADDEAVIIPVFKDNLDYIKDELSDTRLVQFLMSAAENKDFKGKAETLCDLNAPVGIKAQRYILLGLGEKEKLSLSSIEKSCSTLGAALHRTGSEKASILLLNELGSFLSADMTAKMAIAMQLRCYEFEKYRTKKEDEKKTITELRIFTPHYNEAIKIYENYLPVVEGVFLARDLVNEPANVLYPETFAQRTKEFESLDVEVKVLGEAEMQKLGMGSLLGVGQGSIKESKLVTMMWKGADNKGDAPLAFVGKGVCFDSGGISLKPGAGMWDMIMDMGGAAAVAGTVYALAKRKAKANIVGVIGLVENMPDGNAQRPGDIVTSMSGQTIEVLNTDAEGRLVLADAMTYCQREFKPKLLIDLATLTGAIITSLGHEYAGLFSNNDELAEQLNESGKKSSDLVWRMPIGEVFNKMLKSRAADMANITGKAEAGSITAACFLQRFIENDLAWVHLDIAGTAWTKEAKYTSPKNATGFGVRLLDQLVRDYYEN